MRDIPLAAVGLIKSFEGCRLSPYHDCVGFPTIGWGSLLSRQRYAELSKWPAISQQEADDILVMDIQRVCRSLARLISVPLTDGQYSALIDFVFNLGAGQFEISTLRKVINRGDYEDAPKQMMRWVYAGGRKLAGLVRRRDCECGLWCS
ncbi:MAG: lysozyme [Rhodobacteraceae bacterium]|nr:lysozyme [Paracoccaceae bacterium]